MQDNINDGERYDDSDEPKYGSMETEDGEGQSKKRSAAAAKGQADRCGSGTAAAADHRLYKEERREFNSSLK